MTDPARPLTDRERFVRGRKENHRVRRRLAEAQEAIRFADGHLFNLMSYSQRAAWRGLPAVVAATRRSE